MSNATHLSAKRFTSWEPKFHISFTKVSTVAVFCALEDIFGPNLKVTGLQFHSGPVFACVIIFYFGWCLTVYTCTNLEAVSAVQLILVDAHIVALVGLNSKYSQCNGHTSFSSNLDKSMSNDRAKCKNKSPVSPEILPIGCTTVS